MRISDWSSDVCSSDLTNLLGPNDGPEAGDAAGSTCGVAPTMRVLHLSTFDIRGGAARGTYWLHQALARRDVASRMLVRRKYSRDPTRTEPPHRLHRIPSAVRGQPQRLPTIQSRPRRGKVGH